MTTEGVGNDAPAMVALGDSVVWGQGLTEENKFTSLVCFSLQQKFPGLQVEMLAHSGAVIGVGIEQAWPRLPGEVPASGPTILDECKGFAGDPNAVKLVVLDGGINDIDVRFILNPLTSADALSQRIEQHCYLDIKVLLQNVCQTFSNGQCRVVLTGYYPILSNASEEEKVPLLLKAIGIEDAEQLLESAARISDPRDLAMRFWTESDRWFRQAVTEVNQTTGNRITYVLPPFEAKNALFESDPWLWSVGDDLAAYDEVVDQRTDDCIRYVTDWLDCQTCRRASVGHPNPTGAIKYYETIMAALQSIGFC
ncbi:MAG: SGNH/GDSL hydrolase family protein [Candidatus Binataceae bacterium]